MRSCFDKCGAKDRIDSAQFLRWLSAEPQSIVWLPTLHRLAASETGDAYFHDVMICFVKEHHGIKMAKVIVETI